MKEIDIWVTYEYEEAPKGIVPDGAVEEEYNYFIKFEKEMIKFLELGGVKLMKSPKSKLSSNHFDRGEIKITFYIPELFSRTKLVEEFWNYVIFIFSPAMGYKDIILNTLGGVIIPISELNRKEVRNKDLNKIFNLLENHPETLYLIYGSEDRYKLLSDIIDEK